MIIRKINAKLILLLIIITLLAYLLIILQKKCVLHFGPSNEDPVIFPLLSATNFQQLQNMTFGSVKRKMIVETVEMVQFDMMNDVSENLNEIECIYLVNAKPAYHACIHNNDMISDRVRKNLYWESGTQNLIKKFFDANPNSTFVDVGSNVGFHSIFAATLNANIRILAVEPFPKNVLLMHKAAHLNKVQHRIEVILAAMSDKHGFVTFYEKNGSFAENSLLSSSAKDWYKGLVTSSLILDDLTPLIRTKKVFLKVDVEGYECHVFSRADKFFDEFDIPIVFTEIRHTKRQPCFNAMVKFFKDRNYTPFADYDDRQLDYKTSDSWNTHDMHFRKIVT